MEPPRVFNVNFSGHNIEDAKRDSRFKSSTVQIIEP
jgi:hypothetical protein